MSEWKDIKDAPRDGTVILTYSGDKPMIVDGKRCGTQYGDKKYKTVSWSGWGGGIWQCATTGHNLVASSNDITHFQHLPQPPISEDI